VRSWITAARFPGRRYASIWAAAGAPLGLKREMQSRFESIPRNNGAKKTKHFEASGLDSGFRRNDRFVAGLFYVWRRERLEKNPCFDTHKKATSNEMALY